MWSFLIDSCSPTEEEKNWGLISEKTIQDSFNLQLIDCISGIYYWFKIRLG